jgi:ribA/ribD-fused uncharacterized protein
MDYWISEDYPPEILRKILFPVYRATRQQMEDPSSFIKTASLSMDKLQINSKVFTVNDIEKLPPSIHPVSIATKTDKDRNVTVFYSRNSVLSNFFQNAPFNLDGTTYNCTEQFIQHAKATLFGDQETAYKIMKATDPLTQCKLGKKIKGYNNNRWMDKVEGVMYKCNMAKYEQNEAARRVLFLTGSNTLGEASRSNIWGIGLSINHMDVTNMQRWEGRNIFGKCLQRVRDELQTVMKTDC